MTEMGVLGAYTKGQKTHRLHNHQHHHNLQSFHRMKAITEMFFWHVLKDKRPTVTITINIIIIYSLFIVWKQWQRFFLACTKGQKTHRHHNHQHHHDLVFSSYESNDRDVFLACTKGQKTHRHHHDNLQSFHRMKAMTEMCFWHVLKDKRPTVTITINIIIIYSLFIVWKQWQRWFFGIY